MADKKISALTSATTPLAGTEVLPIVQSGATVKVAVSDLTAGRAISATSVTASTGNFVVGTSGQGVDFSATPGTGTSELFNDYEIGTWTPGISGSVSNPTVTVASSETGGRYTKIGNTVFFSFEYRWSAISGGSGDVSITGLPFTRVNNTQPGADVFALESRGNTYLGDTLTGNVNANTTTIVVFANDQVGGAGYNLQCSGLGTVGVGFIRGSGQYIVTI
jgi:hypothetical protein